MHTSIEDWFAENEPASLSTLAPCFQESRLFALRKIALQAATASQDATKTKVLQEQFKDLTMLCKSVSRGLRNVSMTLRHLIVEISERLGRRVQCIDGLHGLGGG